MFDGFETKSCQTSGNFPTLQQVRKDLVGEIDAVLQYDQHIHETTNNIAKQTWQHIRDEELVHIGELLALWKHLSPSSFAFISDGMHEFEEHKNEWTSE